MDTYFNFMFKAFSYISLGLGALLAVLAVTFACAWALSNLYTSRKYWRTLAHATAIRIHGKEAADKFFWRALDERAEKSAHEAKLIIERAKRHLPSNKHYPPNPTDNT